MGQPRDIGLSGSGRQTSRRLVEWVRQVYLKTFVCRSTYAIHPQSHIMVNCVVVCCHLALSSVVICCHLAPSTIIVCCHLALSSVIVYCPQCPKILTLLSSSLRAHTNVSSPRRQGKLLRCLRGMSNRSLLP